MASLHPQLEQNCIQIGNFPLCRLLLVRDSNYPWFILVPDREKVTELYQLSSDDQTRLMHESCYLSEELARNFNADKMNVATIGNLVPQLHIHHVVRYENDIAWPSPVWGKMPVKPYASGELELLITKLKKMRLGNFSYCT